LSLHRKRLPLEPVVVVRIAVNTSRITVIIECIGILGILKVTRLLGPSFGIVGIIFILRFVVVRALVEGFGTLAIWTTANLEAGIIVVSVWVTVAVLGVVLVVYKPKFHYAS
jgi:hypothetical protein